MSGIGLAPQGQALGAIVVFGLVYLHCLNRGLSAQERSRHLIWITQGCPALCSPKHKYLQHEALPTFTLKLRTITQHIP